MAKQDNFGMGVLVAFGLLFVFSLLLGWIPLVGWILAPLIAGYYGGKRVSTTGKGFLVGFTAAMVWALISVFIYAAYYSALYGSSRYGVITYFGMSYVYLLFISSALSGIFCGLGGAAGARAKPAVPVKLLVCQSCGTENPYTSRHCSNCGKSLRPSITDAQLKSMVLGYLTSRGGEIDLDECAAELKLSKAQVKRAIADLREEGKIEEE